MDAASSTRAIVRPAAIPDVYRLDRLPPSDVLADPVAVFWLVTWDLPAGAGHDSLVLSCPAVDLSFAPDGVWGCPSRRS